jgi:hypothetical protein
MRSPAMVVPEAFQALLLTLEYQVAERSVTLREALVTAFERGVAEGRLDGLTSDEKLALLLRRRNSL